MTEQAKWNVVWITGASTGIGYELARLLDREVETLVVSARSADKLAKLGETSSHIISRPLDVADRDSVNQCVKEIEHSYGGIDLAVLNAGIWSPMRASEIDIDIIRQAMEVNYFGVMNALASVLPGMLARGQGHIAITASVAGYRGLPKSISYGPTKAALINLAETLKSELAPRGITISLINPGFVDTPMTESNTFPMPQIISAEKAASEMLDGLKKEKFEIIFPFGFGLVMKCLRLLPDRAFFWFVRKFVTRG